MKLIMEHFPRSEMEITNLDLVFSLISGLDNLGEPVEALIVVTSNDHLNIKSSNTQTLPK